MHIPPTTSIHLPPELIIEVFEYFDAADLCQCCLVSHAWRELSNLEGLWQTLCRISWKEKKLWIKTTEVSGAEILHALQETSSSSPPAKSTWKSCYTLAKKESRRSSVTVNDVVGDWILQVGARQRCDPILAHFRSDFGFYSENTGTLKWEKVGNTVILPDLPPLQVSRTADWGWKLHCPYFTFHKLKQV
ncbi:hypothetical protein K493DRAFT_305176 [Basidiobolus meristosporus CBS 931.73]|uniref:F-box domain-containing protein n=1 Tax=Basidiobolus meristosporus CBS 931.73 TaxID=1314790 RepID=A0A1Y1XWL0_9FUNG|nr:hypothetical protein K493DRAFT_305176 [Basidiobolus meristosporus CBS 931.73]|eukprot:ORX90141.1 hypothetical protein K493DRAFT_305176 [Basidiobolus meristosporus CBS 931.73]